MSKSEIERQRSVGDKPSRLCTVTALDSQTSHRKHNGRHTRRLGGIISEDFIDNDGLLSLSEPSRGPPPLFGLSRRGW